MIIGTLSKKGQIVIPKDIRNKLKLQYGDSFLFKIKGKEIILQKIEEKIIDILESSKPFPKKAVEYQKQIRSEWD
jgi:AbrB family looped-hinge helix DNA binding protein